jgi:predicted secreted protein
MGIAGSLMVLIISWWLAFFVMLPIGVRSHLEENSVVPGSEPSAPVTPNLGWKALAAFGIALVMWGSLYAIIEYGLVTI